MSLFCLLWIPVFYFFRRFITVSPVQNNGVWFLWSLLPGCAAVLVQYLIGSLVTQGGFGFSRWVSGFIDIVSLPVLVPLIVYFIFIALRVFPASVDYTNFTLLWLIPLAAFRSISWNFHRSPMMLVFVPLLWTAQAVGIPFFVHFIVNRNRWYILIPSVLGAIILPLAAATSWWAFFSQQTLTGFLLLAADLIPAVISVVRDFVRKK